jgi:hypothetical protein
MPDLSMALGQSAIEPYPQKNVIMRRIDQFSEPNSSFPYPYRKDKTQPDDWPAN